jgi:hypothetical protein
MVSVSPKRQRIFAVVCAVGLSCASTPAQPDAGTYPVTDAGPVIPPNPVTDAGGSTDSGVPSDAGGSADAGQWISLFDGKTLSGWRRYLGPVAPGEEPLGSENDPKGVFKVVADKDGEPAIRISGEVWGALISRVSFSRFEFEAEYKWGTLLFPPLNAFDSGIMYFSVGPDGAVNAGGPSLSEPPGSGAFLVSMEYQLTPSDVGGMYNLGPIEFRAGPAMARQERAGQWNAVSIRSDATGVTHFLNGEKVRSASTFVLKLPGDATRPLEEGALQLQSEGSEIFFRRVRIRGLD